MGKGAWEGAGMQVCVVVRFHEHCVIPAVPHLAHDHTWSTYSHALHCTYSSYAFSSHAEPLVQDKDRRKQQEKERKKRREEEKNCIIKLYLSLKVVLHLARRMWNVVGPRTSGTLPSADKAIKQWVSAINVAQTF